jgi:chromate transporter
MTGLAIIYAHFGNVDVLRRSLAGISCAAVGLLIAVVFRMITPLLKRIDAVGLILMLAVFAAIGVLRLPLQAVLLVAIPVSIAVTFVLRRKAAA